MPSETHDDIHDELHAPRFEDRLWSELADLHADIRTEHAEVDAQATPADGASTGRRGSRARRSLVVGAGALAAAAALLVGVLIGDDGDPATTGPHGSARPPATELVARVRTATDHALTDSVVHIVTVLDVGRIEVWVDETSHAFRMRYLSPDGSLINDQGMLSPPAPDDHRAQGQRYVDHCRRDYYEHTTPNVEGRIETESIRAALTEGTLVEDGTEIIDGQELLRLRGTIPEHGSDEGSGHGSEAGAGGREVGPGQHTQLWVDPDTYRLVRLVSSGDDSQATMTFDYLARTPTNLAELVPPVPEGFTQVAEPAADTPQAFPSCTS